VGAEVEEAEEKEYHGEIESKSSGDDKNEESESESELEGDDYFDIITEQGVSLNPPPPSSPLVLVNLGAVCGCPPEEESERSMLVTQLTEALLGAHKKENGKKDKESDEVVEEEERTKRQGGGDGSSNLLGDGFSLDFDEGVVELFESGVAFHVDSSNPIAVACLAEDKQHVKEADESKTRASAVNPYAVIPYPEFLSRKQQLSTTATTRTRSTLRLWKLLHTSPIKQRSDSSNGINSDNLLLQQEYSPLLHRVFTHLRNTSRSLLWKADMHHQLSLLVKQENRAKIQRSQRAEYESWKYTVRRERLEKLYDVRETFTLQLEVAQKKYEMLAEETEERVEGELRKRGLLELRNKWRDKTSETLDAGISSLPQEVESEKRNDDDSDDDGWGDATIREEDILGQNDTTVPLEEEEDECQNDEWSPLETAETKDPLGMKIVVDGLKSNAAIGNHETPSNIKELPSTKTTATHSITATIGKLEPISHLDNIQRKLERQQQQQLTSSPSAAPNAVATKHQEDMRRHLQRQEESIREKCKTNEERLAHATYLKLQERLSKVDNLLESLQEEEWACEEEEEEEEKGSARITSNTTQKNKEGDATLLDQILAMILGGLPPKEMSSRDFLTTKRGRIEEKEHYKYIVGEHKSIVKEWKDAFGRIPPFPCEERAPKALEQERESPLLDGSNNYENNMTSPLPPSNQLKKQPENGANGKEKEKGIALTGNEDSNWEEVEDWDAIFPINI